MRTAPLIAALLGLSAEASSGRAAEPAAGGFFREYWYERGIEHGNPDFNSRFRVNAPEAVLHPSHGQRREVRGNGMMLIRADEDLRRLTGAELYLELWGGHPGTANKRVTINGRSTYALPRNGTEDKHCTHSYPTLPLKLTDLVNGYNALQFACDTGSTFWGHFIVDNAALRLWLTNGHPALQQAGLTDFTATVDAWSATSSEAIELSLVMPRGASDRIASVDFQGFYDGYDENGGGRTHGWHGFTKQRQPVATLGVVTNAPFAVSWDTAMLPEQSGMSARAVVRFRDPTNLVYVTTATGGLSTAVTRHSSVTIHATKDAPAPFWSRAGRLQRCTIGLDVDPERIERAELHVVVWDGGTGTVKDSFKLNGQPLAVAGGGRHDVIYSRLPIDPKLLRQGSNVIELLSDTEHHGIEVLRPGPALVVRSQK